MKLNNEELELLAKAIGKDSAKIVDEEWFCDSITVPDSQGDLVFFSLGTFADFAILELERRFSVNVSVVTAADIGYCVNAYGSQAVFGLGRTINEAVAKLAIALQRKKEQANETE